MLMIRFYSVGCCIGGEYIFPQVIVSLYPSHALSALPERVVTEGGLKIAQGEQVQFLYTFRDPGVRRPYIHRPLQVRRYPGDTKTPEQLKVTMST